MTRALDCFEHGQAWDITSSVSSQSSHKIATFVIYLLSHFHVLQGRISRIYEKSIFLDSSICRMNFYTVFPIAVSGISISINIVNEDSLKPSEEDV